MEAEAYSCYLTVACIAGPVASVLTRLVEVGIGGIVGRTCLLQGRPPAGGSEGLGSCLWAWWPLVIAWHRELGVWVSFVRHDVSLLLSYYHHHTHHRLLHPFRLVASPNSCFRPFFFIDAERNPTALTPGHGSINTRNPESQREMASTSTVGPRKNARAPLEVSTTIPLCPLP